MFLGCSSLVAGEVIVDGQLQSKKKDPGKLQPVAKPKKKEAAYDPRLPGTEQDKSKKDDPPLVKIDEETGHAQLPITLVRNRLELMKDGGKAYISLEAIKVDSKRHVWLHPQTLVGPKGNGRLVLVTKETAGYSIAIENTDYLWDAEDFEPASVKWIAVKNITTK